VKQRCERSPRRCSAPEGQGRPIFGRRAGAARVSFLDRVSGVAITLGWNANLPVRAGGRYPARGDGDFILVMNMVWITRVPRNQLSTHDAGQGMSLRLLTTTAFRLDCHNAAGTQACACSASMVVRIGI